MASMKETLAELGARALKDRRLVRAPIWVYRAGLGFVLGPRLLMLEHTGRKSGRQRFVVLEVVDHPRPHEYLVVSGLGEESQWYRNIQANPDVRVSTGLRRSVPAEASPLDAAESAKTLLRYRHGHPTAWAKLRPTIEHAVGRPVTELPMVRLTLAETARMAAKAAARDQPRMIASHTASDSRAPRTNASE